MEYPAKMISRAKELWLEPTPPGGKKRTFADVAAIINAEFSTKVTRQVVQQWQKTFGWSVQSVEALKAQAMDAALTPPRIELSLTENAEPDLTWEWENRKMKFLTTLAGVAEDCFIVARKQREDGSRLEFRDAESALKTGMTAIELIGKMNSGKFEESSSGDKVPALKESQVNLLVNFFINPSAPEPDIKPVTTYEVEGTDVADSDGPAEISS